MERQLDPEIERLLSAALDEDVGEGDWTSEWTVDAGQRAEAVVVAKESIVVAGAALVERVFLRVDDGLEVETLVPDGGRAETGDPVLRVRGKARGILTAERTALNFLGRLSGIATLTRRFVDRVAGTGARITDTRKTTPGWRRLEKEAVRAGGGENHRMGLYDMVLVKDNHIVAAGGIEQAVRRVRDVDRKGLPLEVEVAALDQLSGLRELAVNRILLDNMELGELRRAVEEVSTWPPPRPELEASGNMTLERVREVAETGVEWISVGALTHSAPTADLSLRVVGRPGRTS